MNTTSSFYEIFESWGIPINWTFVKVGMSFVEYEYRIKANEVFDYVCNRVEKGMVNNNLEFDVLQNADNDVELKKLVEKLADMENLDYEVENRKWILYVVYKAINSITTPPTNDELFLLGDLWTYLGMPKHYPWDVKHTEYIKCDNPQEMLKIHKEWVKNEIESLVG